MILVTGATGTVGGGVLTRLLERGERVRALTRNPDAALPEGVEVAVGAPRDTAAVTAALDGVDAVFLVLVGDVEAEVRGFTAALAAVRRPPRVVLLSSLSVLHPVPHRIAEEHRAAEAAVAAATERWTFLRPGPFHSNALWWSGSVRGTGTVRCLVGNRPGAPIDPGDVAAVAVAALTEEGHTGHAYDLTGPQVLTSGDQARILARAAGRPIAFEVAPAEQAVAVFASAGGDRAVAEGNVAALRSREVPWGYPTGTAERLLGRPARTFHAWAAEHAAAFG
ncbi:NAD(P)H-binding protein [Actinokineospora bangkokensis]|uniref:NmrA family transcriptional regulator n=1 Tax=Actinokineospora bangkokensis TaxID=1193682 RepID=A0A1Q9LC51_9PSEU|nr:NAD(P)H-binding protein [Actinokineospora bangkokensis]OLR89593.1 NmrA family transcriptional regulator [Actinokineospora bangkokensis]